MAELLGTFCAKAKLAFFHSRSAEERPDIILIHSHMQISTGDAHIRVPHRVTNFGQRAPTSQRMADERMSAVMDRQRPQPLRSQNPARRPKPLPQRMA
jgi:hypothetical protein